MSRFAQIIATVENLEEQQNQGNAQNLVQVQNELNDGVSEMTEDIAESESIDAGMEAGEQTVQKLDELKEAVEETADENGEVSEFVEKAAVATYESLMASLGVSVTISTMESFNTGSGIVATLEAQSEGIFNKILTGLKAVFETVIQFFGNLLRNRASLIKYLEKTKAKLASVTDDTQLAKVEDVKYFASPKTAVAAISTAEKCIEFSEGAVSIMREIEKTISENKIQNNDNIVSGEKAKQGDSGFVEGDGDKTINAGSILTKELKKVFGVETGVLGVSVGGKEIKVEGDKFSTQEPKTPESVSGANLSDLSEIINKALFVAKKLQKMEKVDGAIKAFFKNVIGTFKRIMAADERNPGKNLFLKESVRVRVLVRTIGTFMPGVAFKTLKACGDYVNKYISGSKAADKDTGDAGGSNQNNNAGQVLRLSKND